MTWWLVLTSEESLQCHHNKKDVPCSFWACRWWTRTLLKRDWLEWRWPWVIYQSPNAPHRPSSPRPHRHRHQPPLFMPGLGASYHFATVAVVHSIMSPCHWARSKERQTFFKEIHFLRIFLQILLNLTHMLNVMQYSIVSTDCRHIAPDIAKLANNLLASHESDLRGGCQSLQMHFCLAHFWWVFLLILSLLLWLDLNVKLTWFYLYLW